MSMIRAQEYFAPLRSRHISLQQWERGLLFESWGSGGGRVDRRKPRDPGDKGMTAPSDSESEAQDFHPVKKSMARSVSFSASLGREVGAEVKSGKNFARGLSFPRSLASNAETIPEESDYRSSNLSRSNAADMSSMFPAQTSTAYLFPRSLERVESGRKVEWEISESSCQDSEDSSDFSDRPVDHQESRPWPKRFFSGGLSFSRDKKFFSGVLSFSRDKKFFSGSLSLPKPCGKSLDRCRSWSVANDTDSTHIDDQKCDAAATSSSMSRFKNKFLARVLTFSRSLDPRGEISSPSSEYGSKSNGRTVDIRRGLSFSRSLDVNGEIFSSSESDYCDDSRSFNSGRLPELTWSRRFISRSGLFFSRSSSPKVSRAQSPAHVSVAERSPLKDLPEVRPRKLFGRTGFSFSLSRFLDPNGDSSSVNSATSNNGPGKKVDKSESQFKRFFKRSFFFPNSTSGNAVSDQQPSGGVPACETTGSFESAGNSAKSMSKRLFSRDWTWTRNKSRSTSPSKNSTQNLVNPRNSSATDDAQSSDTDSKPPSRHSQALKNWWSKRCQSGISSKSAFDQESSRLVLLEKMPVANGDESDSELTVYVGERGGTLTKYVLAKQILRHHLFQVLLKCSRDELGSDHDYKNGVPIICDPALFLQVAKVVGGNFSSEVELCR